MTDETNVMTDFICNVGSSTELYDLQGRKFSSKSTKGIYIKNRKKNVVR